MNNQFNIMVLCARCKRLAYLVLSRELNSHVEKTSYFHIGFAPGHIVSPDYPLIVLLEKTYEI